MTAWPLGRGEDQEAGEGVAGAALARQAVVPGRLQRDRVPDLQLQHRRAGRDQETVRDVAQRHVDVGALQQLQTHLEGSRGHGQEPGDARQRSKKTEVGLTLLLADTW